jgi:hypothetical protein
MTGRRRIIAPQPAPQRPVAYSTCWESSCRASTWMTHQLCVEGKLKEDRMISYNTQVWLLAQGKYGKLQIRKRRENKGLTLLPGNMIVALERSISKLCHANHKSSPGRATPERLSTEPKHQPTRSRSCRNERGRTVLAVGRKKARCVR